MIAEQYAYFPALNASLNGTSAVLLLTGRVLIARGRMAAHRICMIAAVAASLLFLGCYLYFHSKVGNIRFSGRRMVAPRLFRNPDFAHGTSGDNRPVGGDHPQPRPKSSLRQTSRHSPLDLAAVDVRFDHRSNRLFHAVPVVPTQLAFTTEARSHGESKLRIVGFSIW